MKKIYIVIKGGCLLYVSTDSTQVIKHTEVILIDMDDQEDSETSLEEITKAEKLPRIW